MNAPFATPTHVIAVRREAVKFQPRTKPTRAKKFSDEEFELALERALAGAHPLRDVALLRLCFNCGLRAKEVAGLQWERHILDASGEIGKILTITSEIGKKCRERTIPINTATRNALELLHMLRPRDKFVIYPLHRGHRSSSHKREVGTCRCHPNTIAKYLWRFYHFKCRLKGSSHAGRRTFITNLAQRCNTVNASIRDVQLLAGHANLDTTAGYIEELPNQRPLVELLR